MSRLEFPAVALDQLIGKIEITGRLAADYTCDIRQRCRQEGCAQRFRGRDIPFAQDGRIVRLEPLELDELRGRHGNAERYQMRRITRDCFYLADPTITYAMDGQQQSIEFFFRLHDDQFVAAAFFSVCTEIELL